jgi:hypothetical protein
MKIFNTASGILLEHEGKYTLLNGDGLHAHPACVTDDL